MDYARGMDILQPTKQLVHQTLDMLLSKDALLGCLLICNKLKQVNNHITFNPEKYIIMLVIRTNTISGFRKVALLSMSLCVIIIIKDTGV